MANLSVTVDVQRARQLETLALAYGYASAASFAGAKAAEIIDREWASYLDSLVGKAQSGTALTAAERTLVMAKLGLV